MSYPWSSFCFRSNCSLLPREAALTRLGSTVDKLTVVLASTAPSSACPLCDFDSSRVHSRYTRHLADLPCFGRAVQLHVTVRRFFCTEVQCPRLIFAERLPGFAAPHARTTALLRETHEAIGYALGGEPGSRLTVRLAIATSPDTLLRRVKQLEDESEPPPRFVGIDDWAWRKDDATAPSSSTWSKVMSSISCPIAMRRP